MQLYIKLGKRVGLTIRQLGYRRLHASLSDQFVRISEKVVRRLMKQECLIAATSKRRRYGSYMGEISPTPDNVLNRDFNAGAPNEKWLAGTTRSGLRVHLAFAVRRSTVGKLASPHNQSKFLSASPVGQFSVIANTWPKLHRQRLPDGSATAKAID